jgi:hypothetical protein
MINRDDFLKKYRIASSDFDSTELKWAELEVLCNGGKL